MNQSNQLSFKVIVAGVFAIILLTALPLVLIQDSGFGGSDGVGSDIVAEIAPTYNSEWIANVWTPPGGETESMLFALQAAAGGVLIGYCFGFLRGRKHNRVETNRE